MYDLNKSSTCELTFHKNREKQWRETEKRSGKIIWIHLHQASHSSKPPYGCRGIQARLLYNENDFHAHAFR
jgi:uncharacterized protein YdeI (YjbR/CyaY-like superfamily)